MALEAIGGKVRSEPLNRNFSYLDSKLEQIKLDVDILNERTTKILNVAEFGVIADGIADDTLALQNALDNAEGHVILFPPNGTVKISDTVIADVSKVRGIYGFNARINITVDKPAIRIKGSHTGTANPDTTTENVMLNEMNPIINGLRIFGVLPHGTGIEVEGVFGLQITGCHLFNLRNGVVFKGINRNIIMNGNHIWNIVDYGIFLDSTDSHQFILNGNHISYCKKALYSFNSSLYNLELTGNDIECNKTRYVAPYNLIHIVGGNIEGLTAVGNNLEDHYIATDYLIKIEGALKTQQVHFVGNEIGNGLSGTFYFNGGKNIVIANNSDTQGKGNFIGFHCTQDLSNVVIEGNVFQPLITNDDTIDDQTECSFLKINGTSDEVNSHFAGGIVVSNNVANLLCGHFVRIYKTRIFQVNISDNVFDNSDLPGGFWEKTNFFAIKIAENIEYIRQLRISGNHYRGRNVANSGIYIESPIESLIIISENTFREIKNPNILPTTSSSTIVRDNIGI